VPDRMAIVGAGIVGLAVARRALLPAGLAEGAAVRTGEGLLQDFYAEHGLDFDECGKLVVARAAGELPAPEEIERRATANAVPGLRRLSGAELREVEPEAVGAAALHSPHTAIVDYRAVARAMADDLRRQGHDVRLGFEVTQVLRGTSGGVVVCSAEEAFAADRLVVCAGLQADLVSRLAGDEDGPAIVPFRGEYHRLLPEREHLVRGLIYPVPDPRYPFLGVHFTRRVGGGVDIGPNAVLALAPGRATAGATSASGSWSTRWAGRACGRWPGSTGGRGWRRSGGRCRRRCSSPRRGSSSPHCGTAMSNRPPPASGRRPSTGTGRWSTTSGSTGWGRS
jgi:glycine/D-amino acid oxidase-like deaminating enzyme